ncbi:kelch-like protein 42 isoform X2 [Thalassophryne amazonica]|uniref:kelch-like protein 42 isoform X2 n=1 Tax=Thalassophryne amazonica TaxID=390379 RepID=UPI0014725667|nr:kelch-like protein 42 isoform X2 [Thalassophryne amazonica]
MNLLCQSLMIFFEWISFWVKRGLMRVWRVFPTLSPWTATSGVTNEVSYQAESEEWKTSEERRTFILGDKDVTMVTVQTSTHAFYVDLRKLSDCSEYFQALSQSTMKETSENLIHLDHVSSSIFYHLLEFSFHNRFKVPQEELGAHIQVSSYLLAEAFLSKCLLVLAKQLSPDNCLFYLNLAQEICCEELRATVFTYLSRNLLELPHLISCLDSDNVKELIRLRTQGDQCLCSLRKENLTSWDDPETERARYIFTLNTSEIGSHWQPVSELPFHADKWCFTTVVLFNYLYIIGGHRQHVRKAWEFKMASFRYNPFTLTWVATAPLIKRRRHFSAVACEGCIYALGGWYLGSLVTPDSSTALYTAVECYNPWTDTWRFVSSLPITDFQFTMSLSHDVPLATSLGHCVYVLGSIQRTGEKLLLQYNTRQDSWCELLPTLTRTDANLSILYFLGATDRLFVIGGNNAEILLTSFCVRTQKWGKVHRADKAAFAGQGTVLGDQVLMPSIEHNTVAKMDLQTLSMSVLPPFPVSAHYEAIFHLHF